MSFFCNIFGFRSVSSTLCYNFKHDNYNVFLRYVFWFTLTAPPSNLFLKKQGGSETQSYRSRSTWRPPPQGFFDQTSSEHPIKPVDPLLIEKKYKA